MNRQEKHKQHNHNWYLRNKAKAKAHAVEWQKYNPESVKMSRHKQKKLLLCRKNERHMIENYELAKSENFKGWCIHHRLELTINGEYAISKADLKRMGMYYHRPYFELIFMRNSEHSTMHKLAEWKHKKSI